MENAFFCENCCTQYETPGDCAKCPEEPLLDLRDEDVLQMLQDFDDRRNRKKMGMFTLIFGVVFLPVLYGFATMFSGIAGLLIYGGAVSGATTFALKKWPALVKTPAI